MIISNISKLFVYTFQFEYLFFIYFIYNILLTIRQCKCVSFLFKFRLLYLTMVYLTKLLENTTKFYLYLCLEISE